MFRITAGAAMLVLALVLAFPAFASSPPVGPLPPGPVTSISTPKGTLVSVALLSRAGKSWRLARAVSPKILVEVSEANVGASVVIVYRAVGRGDVSVRYGLTRGETRKAYASATFKVHVT
jgi:hypothetical protein